MSWLQLFQVDLMFLFLSLHTLPPPAHTPSPHFSTEISSCGSQVPRFPWALLHRSCSTLARAVAVQVAPLLLHFENWEMRSELTLTPMSSPCAFHSLLFFVYHLSANLQSISWYSHQNQLEPVSQSRLTDIFSQSFLEFWLCIVDTRSLFSRYTLFLLSVINYQKKSQICPEGFILHIVLFLTIADDLIELKIVTDFSHLIPTPLFQGMKSTDFFLLNSFIDKVKDFSFLLQIHCENRRQFSQMEICHIIMEMSDFYPGHIDKKP